MRRRHNGGIGYLSLSLTPDDVLEANFKQYVLTDAFLNRIEVCPDASTKEVEERTV